jgi:Family of unknown function (DUF6335)
MAKRKAARRLNAAKAARKRSAARRPARRQTGKRRVKRQASAKKKAPARKPSKKVVPKVVAKKKPVSQPAPKAAKKARSTAAIAGKVPRLDRARRTLDDGETMQTPPSSLDMERRGSAARTGRAEIAENIREHHGMDDVTGGDPDVDIEDAYFAGEEAPGGNNPTPDQDIVEDIGKALGVTYEDSEELKGANKLEQRDKHRWELDPASAEDYTEHDKD